MHLFCRRWYLKGPQTYERRRSAFAEIKVPILLDSTALLQDAIRAKVRWYLIIVFLILVFAFCFLVISDLPHCFNDFVILLVSFLVPVNVVLASNLLDFFTVSVRFFNERVPFLNIETLFLIQLRLFATDC